MRLDQFTKGQWAANTRLRYALGNGHINGLYISCPPSESALLSVRLRGEDGTHVLVQDMAISVLGAMSKQEVGGVQTRGMMPNAIAQLIADLRTVPANDTVLADYDNVDLLQPSANDSIRAFHQFSPAFYDGAVFIELGSIYLNGEDSLEISLDFKDGSHAGTNVSIFGYSGSRAPYALIKYESIKEPNRTFHACSRLYAHIPANFKKGQDGRFIVDKSPTLQISDSVGTTFVNYEDLLLANASRAAGLVAPTEVLPLAYSLDVETPQSVTARATGAGANDVQWINVQAVFPERRVRSSLKKEIEQMAVRLAQLERDEPETAKALQIAGQIPDSRQATVSATVIDEPSKFMVK